MPTIVDSLLTQACVELEHYKKSHWDFVIELLPTFLAAGFLCFFPWLFFPSLKIGCSIAWVVISFLLLRENWERIGTRRVVADVANQRLVMDQHFPHDPYARSEVIPFRDLLLHRHWRSDDESRSSAFVLRVQIGKNVDSPDCAGYLLHEELVFDTPRAADLASLKLAEEIVKATGIEFFDIQASTDPRFAIWVNQSLRPDHHSPTQPLANDAADLKA